jgi:hypothetical protein
MWSPNRRQWTVIWIAALVVLLAWPAGTGSLGIKLVRWAADPMQTLPELPEPLPAGLDDNGDAVAAHDAQLGEYYRRYNESAATRRRMEWKEAEDPLERTMERQVLVAFGLVSALAVWAMQGRR